MAAAVPSVMMPSEPRDGSWRKSPMVPVNSCFVRGALPHPGGALPDCANAGALLHAPMKRRSAARFDIVVDIESLVIVVVRPFVRIRRDASCRREGGSTHSPALPRRRRASIALSSTLMKAPSCAAVLSATCSRGSRPTSRRCDLSLRSRCRTSTIRHDSRGARARTRLRPPRS